MTEVLTLEADGGFASARDVALPPPPPPFQDKDSMATVALSLPPEETSAAVPPVAQYKTLEDLTLESANWTLHSDHALHAFLQRYSTDLFTRTKHVENRVRDIAAEADAAHVRLKNTLNQFLMLSNNQFMENRVYDEEQEDFFGVASSIVTVETRDETEIREEPRVATEQELLTTSDKDTRAKRAAESIVTKYRAALEMGMEAMKLFVMMDEEEDEAREESLPHFETVLDIYNERPLPFIIGTREFLEDETLGLGAVPEEESDSDSGSSYTSSYSSSDSDSESDASQTSRGKTKSSHSHSRYRSSSEESEGSLVGEQPPRRRADSDESETSGLFGHPPDVEPSRRRANSDESDTSGLFGRPSAPELAHSQPRASLSRDSRRRPVFHGDEEASDDSDWTSDSDDGGKMMPTRKQRSTSRRGQEAPSPFAVPRHARTNQFLDSSDEESDAGLFGSTPTTKPRVFATDEAEELKQRSSISAVQPSTSDDPFGGNTSTTQQRDPSKRLNPRRSDSFGSSSSAEEHELFGATSEKKTPTAQAQQQGFRLPPMDETTSRRTNEFESKKSFHSSDSDAESTTSGLFGRPSGAVKDTRKTPAGVSVVPAPQQFRRLDFSDDSSDNDDDGGLFGAAPAKPVTPRVQRVEAPPTATTSASRHRTYSDSSSDSGEDGGELFGAISKVTPGATIAAPVSAPHLQPVQHAPQSGLFGEADSDVSDDSDDGGLFGANKALVTTAPPVVANRGSPVVTQDVSDSDDDGGLFGFPQKTKSNATAPIAVVPTQTRQSRVYSDSSDSDDGDLFGAPPLQSTPTPTPVPISAPTAAATSSVAPVNPLVHQQDSSDDDSDDWSDDDGGLFGVPTSKPTSVKLAAVPVPVVRSAHDAVPSQAAPLGSLFGSPAGTLAPTVHPPIPNAAARMRATESDSDSDSDSDWDGDDGLFGPPKK